MKRMTLLGALLAVACGAPAAATPRNDPPTMVVPAPAPATPLCSPSDAGIGSDAARTTTDADVPPVAHALVVDVGPTKLATGELLRGPCVNPAVHAVEQSAYAAAKTSTEGGPPFEEEFFTAEELDLDLDDDGAADIFLFAGAERTTTTHAIFLRRGPCGYPLGSIASTSALERLDARSHGLHDLRATQELCSGIKSRFCQATYRFDGTRYRLLKRAAAPGVTSPAVPAVDVF